MPKFLEMRLHLLRSRVGIGPHLPHSSVVLRGESGGLMAKKGTLGSPTLRVASVGSMTFTPSREFGPLPESHFLQVCPAGWWFARCLKASRNEARQNLSLSPEGARTVAGFPPSVVQHMSLLGAEQEEERLMEEEGVQR